MSSLICMAFYLFYILGFIVKQKLYIKVKTIVLNNYISAIFS